MLTVVAPATSTALTTTATMRAELGLVAGSQDSRLGELIAQASGLVAGFCEVPLTRFARQGYEEVFRLSPGQPRDVLILTVSPIAEVTDVTVDGAALNPATDLELDAAPGLLTRLRSDTPAPWCARKVVVGYTAGWVLPGDQAYAQASAADRLPKTVERATIEAVKALWFASGDEARDPMLRSESTQGVGSTSWQDAQPASGALPPAAAAMLDSFLEVGL